MSLIAGILNRVAPRLLWRLRVRRWNVQQTEPEMALLPQVCDRRRISVDVGASLGTYTMHLLCYSKACHAFEARPQQAAALAQLFAGSAVSVEAVALSDRPGTAELRMTPNDLGRSTIHGENPLAGMRDVQVVSVPTRTLDSYGLRDVAFVKIDVEGHELAVLRGADETLRREQPVLLIEIEERHSEGAVAHATDFLRARRYSGFFLLDGVLNPISAFQRELHQDHQGTCNRYVNNFLFLPDGHPGVRLR